MESWSRELVEQWLVNIGLGHFAAVLNADKPFTGRELEYTTVAELAKAYKIDKRPAKKIIKERDNALAYMHIKPVRKRSKQVEISYPFSVVHVVHVEYVPGKGLKGLPKEWKENMRSQSSASLLTKKRDSPKRQRSETAHVFSSDEVLRWCPTQVAHWLQQIGLAIFIPEFEAAEIDGRILLSASYAQLAEMLNIGTDKLSQNLFHHIALLRGTTNKRSKANNNKENQRNSIQYSNIEIRKFSF